MRWFSWITVYLVLLNVAFLVALPILAQAAARSLDFSKPDAVVDRPLLPDKREKPLVPISELDKELRLPQVDTKLTDEHSKASIAAYQAGDYEKAFQQAVLSLDSTPLDENGLYRVLMTKLYDYPREPTKQVEKPNGRFAVEMIDRALQPVLDEGKPHMAARLNNAAAMMILYLHTTDSPPPFVSLDSSADTLMGPWAAQELAYQAADLHTGYCPALFNLTLFNGMNHGDTIALTDAAGVSHDLDHAGGPVANAFLEPLGPWTEYYSMEGCEEPALIYHLAQNSISEVSTQAYETGDLEDDSSTLRLANLLQEDARWAGVARSIKGDFYYWSSIYALERAWTPRSFSHRRFLEQALVEYQAASRLQPDDPGIRHGKALVYLEQGKAKEKGGVNKSTLNKAIRKLEAALRLAPNSPRLWQTLVEVYEEKNDHETAARLQREFLSTQRPTATPPTLVPYSPTSHGADRYADLRLYETAGGGAFVDDEVITPYVPRLYTFSYGPKRGWNPLYHISQYRSGLRHYSLVSNDLLGGNYAALETDLQKAPETVQQNDPTAKLMVGIKQLLAQPESLPTPATETQSAINDYIVAYVNSADTVKKIDESMLKNKGTVEDMYLPDYLTDYRSLTDYSGLLRDAGEDHIDPGDELQRPQNSFFYWEAANFLRQHKQYDKALRIYEIWMQELERGGVDEKRRAEVEKLMGEALFLQGGSEEADDNQRQARNKYEEALASFDRAVELRPDWPPYLVRQAFMHEKLGDYSEAEKLYLSSLEGMSQGARWMDPELLRVQEPEQFYSPYNYHAAKHLGDVLLREAEEARQTDEGEDAVEFREEYMAAANKYRYALSMGTVPSKAAAVNNLGIALLRAGYYERSISVLKTLVRPSGLTNVSERECRNFWESVGGAMPAGCEEGPSLPGTPDENNPVFHLNLGWAYESRELPMKAEEHYLAAIRSDDSFHPAINDLGVRAAKDGELDRAKSYFYAAMVTKKKETGNDYAHAAHNLGVALLHSGPQNYLAAQEYLARATEEDPSIGEASYDYIADNELYFLDLSLAGNVPADWQFVREAERSTGMVAGFALLLLLGRILFRYAGGVLRDEAFEKVLDHARDTIYRLRLPRLLRLLRVGVRKLMRFGVPSSGGWWMTPVALSISAPAIVTVMGWDLISSDSGAGWLVLGVLLYLTVVSLLVHHAGHALAGLWFGMRVQEALWPAGIVQALLLVMIQGPAVAPAPANVTEEEPEDREREESLIYLAGPVASLLFSALLTSLFLASHISVLRFGAILSLALAVVSLLLLPPLDGGMVSKRYYTRLLFWAGILSTVLWTIVFLSNELYCTLGPGDSCWAIF